MTAQWILAWWNLIFIVPFGVALLYLGVYTMSGMTFGDADADVDADHDIDTDADADADVDHDVDADQDVDSDADHDTDGDSDHDTDHDSDAESESAPSTSPSSAMLALSWLGIGKVPVSLVLMLLAMSWGFIGFVTNQAMSPRFASAIHSNNSVMVVLVSVPLAGTGALLITSVLSRIAARLLPKIETYALRRHELLGNVGQAIYEITPRFGMVSVRDEHGHMFDMPCRLERDGPALPKGSSVRLTGYNAKENFFYVTTDQRSAS
jgi:Protein of unknown function (DUF1449)